MRHRYEWWLLARSEAGWWDLWDRYPTRQVARLAAELATALSHDTIRTWATVRVDRTKGLDWTLPSRTRPPGARKLRLEADHATA